MARYLVIANETVGGDDLVTEVRDRAGEGNSFHVLVPGTEEPESESGQDAGVAGGGPVGAATFGDPKVGRSSRSSGTTDTPPGGSSDTATGGRPSSTDAASIILEQVVGRLEGVSGEVTGQVTGADAVEAARRALAEQRYEEIILATPPAGASKLIRKDLEHQLEQAVDVPVTTVHAPRTDPREAE